MKFYNCYLYVTIGLLLLTNIVNSYYIPFKKNPCGKFPCYKFKHSKSITPTTTTEIVEPTLQPETTVVAATETIEPTLQPEITVPAEEIVEPTLQPETTEITTETTTSAVPTLEPPKPLERCGRGYGKCRDINACCSRDGYCGWGDGFCMTGCQTQYGQCYEEEFYLVLISINSKDDIKKATDEIYNIIMENKDTYKGIKEFEELDEIYQQRKDDPHYLVYGDNAYAFKISALSDEAMLQAYLNPGLLEQVRALPYVIACIKDIIMEPFEQPGPSWSDPPSNGWGDKPYSFGDWNEGGWNEGPYNFGGWNEGPYNEGPYNSGGWNEGPYNEGPYNGGGWNW